MPMTTNADNLIVVPRRRGVGRGMLPDGPDDGDDDRGVVARPNNTRRVGGVGRPRNVAVATAAAAAACCASATAAVVPPGTGGRAAVAPRGAFGLPVPPRVPRGGSVNDNAGGNASGDDGPASSTSASRRGGGRRNKGGEAEEKGRGRGRQQKDKEKQKQRRQRGPFRSRSPTRDSGGKSSSAPPPSPPPPPQLPDDYYELLGVSRTSTSDEIQRAYRRMAVRTHPDKTDHGDRTHFDAISEAYDVLSDETKRSIYDRYGKRGLEANAAGGTPGGGSFFADDVFRTFFGGAPGAGGFGFSTGSSGFFQRAQPQQRSSQRQRTRSVRYQLEVTLEDLYRGSTRSVVIAKPEADDAPRRKRVDIDVERGMRHGSTVVLSGELDHVPNATPGDMIFVLAQTPHELFTRRNADLLCEVEVSPREALTGIRGEISHLDDRVVELLTDPDGPPVHDGEVRVLRGEGMPVRGRPGRFGDLYVRFKVKWPVTGYAGLTTEERAILGDLMDVAAAAAKSSSNSSASASTVAGVTGGDGKSPSEDEEADVEGIRERLRERLAELLRRGGVGDEAAAAVAASAAEVSSSSSGATPNATAAATTGSANATAPADANAGEDVGAGAGAGGDEKVVEEGGGGRKRGKGRDRQRRTPRYLRPALASDFGASHPDEEGDDRNGNRDHHHHHYGDDDDEEDHFGFSYGRGNPFGQHFGFFSSSSGAGGPGYGDRGGRYYDDAGDAHRESNVQCQQM